MPGLMPTVMPRGRSSGERGLSTLVVLLGLFLVAALATAYANRHLLIEQRMVRAYEDDARAQAAAEWGAERALSLLHAGPVDDDCQVHGAQGLPQRAAERWLRHDAEGVGVQRPGVDAMVCDAQGDGPWQCRCARDGVTPLLRTAGALRSQSLRLSLQVPDRAAGVVRLSVRGCAHASADCQGQAPTVQQHLGWLPALRQLPASALLVQGSVDLGDGLQVVNDDPTTQGLAVHSGGAVAGSPLGVVGPPGSVPADRLLAHDPGLQALGDDGLRRRLLGHPADLQPSPPGVHRLACPRGCGASDVIAAWRQGHRWLLVDGDLDLGAPVDIGDTTHPVLLTVEGRLRWQGGGRLVGAVLVRDDALLGGHAWQVDGALVVGGRVGADRQGRVRRQRAVLLTLQREVGSFVRLPGGRWSPV